MTKIIRILIADDERIGRARLRRLLEREPDLEIVADCASGDAALEILQEEKVDVLFLDIQMPGLDGFDVLDRLGSGPQPLVVFVTAYDEHAVRAFDACALDYVVKPVSPERLTRTIARVRTQLQNRPVAEEPGESSLPAGNTLTSRFVVRSGGRVSFVSPEEIDWIEAAGNYAIFHAGQRSHMIRETMSALENQLPADHFLRVSRSAIVNLARVKELYQSGSGNDAAILQDEQRVPITRSLREVADRLRAV